MHDMRDARYQIVRIDPYVGAEMRPALLGQLIGPPFGHGL
jgi:hypothetical protein